MVKNVNSVAGQHCGGFPVSHLTHSRQTSVVAVISRSCRWDLVGILFLVILFLCCLVFHFCQVLWCITFLASLFLVSHCLLEFRSPPPPACYFFDHLFYSIYFLGDRVNLKVILRSFKIMNYNHTSSRSSLDAPPEDSEASCNFVSLSGHPVFTSFTPNLRSELQKKLKGKFSQISCCTLWEFLFRDRLGCGFMLSLNLLQVFNLSNLLKRCHGFTCLYIQNL